MSGTLKSHTSLKPVLLLSQTKFDLFGILCVFSDHDFVSRKVTSKWDPSGVTEKSKTLSLTPFTRAFNVIQF